MVSVPARRAAVAYARGKGLSQRRACTLLGVARSALNFKSTKTETDAAVVARMIKWAADYIVSDTAVSGSICSATGLS